MRQRNRGRSPRPSDGQQRLQLGIQLSLGPLGLALVEQIIEQLSQLDWPEAKAATEKKHGLEPERLDAAEAVLGAWPVPVSFGGDRACYLPAIDRIQLPDRASFLSPAAFFATWAHEQIHSTGHESRLKRDLDCAFGKACYAREELVAELGSVLLGDRLEIGSEIESHAAYLGHRVGLLKETPKVLFQVLSEARQAVDLICPEPATRIPVEVVEG